MLYCILYCTIHDLELKRLDFYSRACYSREIRPNPPIEVSRATTRPESVHVPGRLSRGYCEQSLASHRPAAVGSPVWAYRTTKDAYRLLSRV